MERLRAGLLPAALIFGLLATAQTDSGASGERTLVQTRLGAIRGVVRAYGNIKVSEFLGVRYAQPPTGYRRFRKPVAVQAWSPATYDALSLGSWCPQTVSSALRDRALTSEDCLFLNVYAPYDSQSTTPARAVAIFIHGGSYQTSSSSRYTGAALAGVGDVVAVTVNYRVNAFGFLSTGDGDAPGNYGLWDQREAFLWVRDNIAAFGGDPTRITLLGQSAGAASVNYHAMSPQNDRKIFQRVIAQSGSLYLPRVFQYAPLAAAQEFARRLQCPTDSSGALVECLRGKSVQDLLQHAGAFTWTPTVDGDFVVDDPKTITQKVLSGSADPYLVGFSSYDYLTGFNSQEAIYYVDRSSAVASINSVSRNLTGTDVRNGVTDEVYGQCVRLIGEYLFKEQTAVNLFVDYARSFYETIYRAQLELQPPSARDRLRLFMQIQGDFGWATPTLHTANLHAKMNGTGGRFLYYYDVKRSFALPRSASWDGPDWLRTGAAHTDEVGTALGYPLLQGLLPNDTFINQYNYSDSERELSRAIIYYWTNFAKTGDPNMGQPLQQPWSNWSMYDAAKKQFLHIRMNQSDLSSNIKPQEDYFWNYAIAPNRNRFSTPPIATENERRETAAGDGQHFTLLVSVAGVVAGLLVVSFTLNVAQARKIRRDNRAGEGTEGKDSLKTSIRASDLSRT